MYADVLVSLAADPLTPVDAVGLGCIRIRWRHNRISGASAALERSRCRRVPARPAVNELDLPTIVDELVTHLQRAGEFRTEYRVGETLRERLGLPKAINRYAGRP